MSWAYDQNHYGIQIKDPGLTKASVLRDVEFCHEYFQPGIKAPVFLEFGLGGAVVGKRMARGQPTFFMSFSTLEHSCMEFLFKKYISVFLPR